MSTCKGCGRTITWALTPDGKKVPLTKVANVYILMGASAVKNNVPLPQYISHFLDCPKANAFSGSNKQAQMELGDK